MNDPFMPLDQFLPLEGLLMGGRDQRQRIDGQIIHVTQLQLFRFEPEPPLFEVKHIAFMEISKGQTMMIGYSISLHDDLDDAHAEFTRVHENPPTDLSQI